MSLDQSPTELETSRSSEEHFPATSGGQSQFNSSTTQDDYDSGDRCVWLRRGCLSVPRSFHTRGGGVHSGIAVALGDVRLAAGTHSAGRCNFGNCRTAENPFTARGIDWLGLGACWHSASSTVLDWRFCAVGLYLCHRGAGGLRARRLFHAAAVARRSSRPRAPRCQIVRWEEDFYQRLCLSRPAAGRHHAISVWCATRARAASAAIPR